MKPFPCNLFMLCVVGVCLLSSCGGDEDDATDADKGGESPVAHSYVSLDTSDGVLWATTNLGATRPEEKGGYFAWAETSAKNSYLWDTYRYCDGYDKSLTKYCAQADYGFEGYTDATPLTELMPEDDAATQLWGSSWRMPSREEWENLIDECDWSQITLSGTPGFRISSRKHPERSIFLPAAGRMTLSSPYSDGETGYYWTRTLDTEKPTYAYSFCSRSYRQDYVCLPTLRYIGASVRPVYLPNK